MEATMKKPSQKEQRLARRWAPKNSEVLEHPDGKSVAFIAPFYDRGTFQAVGYWGTAGKPTFNYVYKTREQAHAKVAEFFASITNRQEAMAKRKEEHKAAAQQPIKSGDYVSVSQTAKLIRVQLAKHFPVVKFSVVSRSYSGGASIDISWIDGPTGEQVQKVTNAFRGSGFDGMIDMEYSMQSWLLPDGSASFGSSRGTEGGRGSDPAYDFPSPELGAIKVHFGADHIFTHREHSAAVLEKVAFKVADDYGLNRPQVKTHADGSAYLDGQELYQHTDEFSRQDLRDLIYRELNKAEG